VVAVAVFNWQSFEKAQPLGRQQSNVLLKKMRALFFIVFLLVETFFPVRCYHLTSNKRIWRIMATISPTGEENMTDSPVVKSSGKGFGKPVERPDSEKVGPGERSEAKRKYQQMLKLAKKSPSLKAVVKSGSDATPEKQKKQSW
jgi:hypothetical protein